MKISAMMLPLLLMVSSAFSQGEVPCRPSPLAIAKMKYKDTYIKITYCRPHKKGREIFGQLVSYGEIWRTGANEATEITVTDTIMIANDTLPTGTYSIFTIPEKEMWTVIFNTELGQWGSYNYLEKSDVFRIEVPVEEITGKENWQAFTIDFDKGAEKADIIMKWDRTQVKIPLSFLH